MIITGFCFIGITAMYYIQVSQSIIYSIKLIVHVTIILLLLGDFRLSLSELRKIDYLHHEATQSPIDINTLYLDTTFCHDQANTIIPRVWFLLSTCLVLSYLLLY